MINRAWQRALLNCNATSQEDRLLLVETMATLEGVPSVDLFCEQNQGQ
jgi:hypothetical protein